MSKINVFKTIYNIITDTWNVLSKYKNEDFTCQTEDKICESMVNELQEIKNKYSSNAREAKLVTDISTTILHFIFFKEDKNGNRES